MGDSNKNTAAKRRKEFVGERQERRRRMEEISEINVSDSFLSSSSESSSSLANESARNVGDQEMVAGPSTAQGNSNYL